VLDYAAFMGHLLFALLLSTAATTILSGGCATNPVSGRTELTLVSTEKEKKIGEEEAKKVEEEMGLLEDARLTAYLDALGQRLAKESPRQDVVYRFHVVDTIEPNAFALPGGYVYVSRGLLALVNDEDELAGVIGHEVGHVAARHSVQKISKQGPMAVVFGIVSGITGLVVPAVGDLIGGIADLTQSLVFARYSRSQETEADRVGQDMAARAGWDPAAMSTFLTTLGREVDLMSKGPRKPTFFDSHPATPDRVAKTAEHAKALKRADRAPLSPSHEAFLAHLDGLVVGQRAANGLILGPAFVHPDLDVFMQFPQGWELENTPQKVVAVAPDKESAVVMGAVGQGHDPLDGARALDKATKSAVSARAQRTTINGLPAAHAQIDAEGKVGVDLTWIAHGGLIYQVVGLAPKQRLGTLQPLFIAAARSFRPLTAAERANVKETRIRLVKAQAGETIQALGMRANSAWTQEEIAVANGLALGDQLKEGQLIKVTVAEPYEPKKARGKAD
jgi:predicted Zn-dependent protease